MSWPNTAALPVTVELYLGGAWVDIDDITGCQTRNDSRVRITYGGTDETPRVIPGSALLAISDPNNTLSGLNPNSVYFDDLGINTPIRITAAGSYVRHVGELGSIKPSADSTENDQYVELVSRGVLSRLQQGGKALKPALERSVLAETPFALWRMDDGTSASTFSNTVAGQSTMTSNDLLRHAAVTGPDGATASLPELVNSDITSSSEGGTGPVVGATGSNWIFEFVHRATDDGTGNAESTPWTWFTAHMGFEIIFSNLSDTAVLVATDVDGSGADITLSASVTNPCDGDWHQYRVVCSLSGSTTTLSLYRDGVLLDSDTGTGSSGDFDHVHPMAEPPAAISALSSSSTGWATIYTNTATPSTYAAVTGHAGETVVERLTRLCAELSISLTIIGADYAGHTMGPQSASKITDLFQQAADVGQGILYETIDAVGVTYRTITSLYNQVATLELDYAAWHISHPLTGVYDDQKLQNDVSASRPGGGSARSVLDDGSRFSISDPPVGVGTYDRGGVTAYVETDDQLLSIASWRRWLGTYRGYRYPTIKLQQSRPEWTGDATLTAALRGLRPGDDMSIDNRPERLREVEPLLRLQARGWTEELSRHMWDMTINCIPGWPWEVWELDTGGSTITSAAAPAATGLSIATSAGPAWSTTAEPYHIVVDGEAMTVTNMVTETPSVFALGAAAHADNAAVVPALPAGIVADNDELLICIAAIRNTAASIAQPAGWTTLATATHFKVFAKYYSTGDTAPTITPSGGAAGDTVSAQIVACRGASIHLDGGPYLGSDISPSAATNSSAQNITVPPLQVRRNGCLLFTVGWKQDDYTSVATISGWTEVGEASTTTGNDQSLVWDYKVDATATNYAATSFVVTGGASAIGKSFRFALRPLQTATVTRQVNGVSKTVASGSAVHGWRLGVIAL